MKKIITLLLVVTATTFIASAQLQLDKKLEMTGGSNTDRQITNLGDPSAPSDAVNVSTVQKGVLVYATATGSGSDYVITIIPSPAAYVTGMIVNFKANHTNTGAATLKVGSLAPISIKTEVTNNLAAGEIANNQMVSVIYDGNNFQLLSRSTSPVSLPPSGAAGGDLTGSYPNPDIATGAVTTAEIANATITATDLANTGVGAGTYNNVTVNAQGQVTSASNAPYGSVTNVATGTGLSGGPISTTGTISIANTGVAPGTYNNVTVNAQGQVTTAGNAPYGSITNVATGTGLAGGPINTTGTISIANTGVAPGTYNNVTVNAQGQVTTAGNTAYLTSETDGSITNEGSLSVGAGASNTSLIQSNTSGSGTVTLTAGSGIALSESGNDITVTATPTIYAAGTGIGISSGTITNTLPSLWTQSGSNLYPNNLAWNTGIGTAAPVQKMEVNGRTVLHNGGTTYNNAGAAELQIGYALAGSGTVGEVARLALQPYGHTGGPFLFVNRDNASSAFVDFRYGASNLLTIDHNGNMGMGTQSPARKLDVRGNTMIGDGTVFGDSRLSIGGTNGNNDAAITMKSSSSGTVFSVLAWSSQVYIGAGVYYSDANWVHDSDDGNNQLFTLDPGNGTYWYASNNGAGSWNVASGLLLWDDPGHWKSTVQSTRGGNSYFTGGNLGVGTSSPGYKLHVSGGAIGGNTAYLPGYAAWASFGTGDGQAAIYNDGSSYYKLMIVGNSSAGGSRQVGIWDDLTVASNLTVGALAGSGTRMVATNSSGTLVPASIDARNVNSYVACGMAEGKRYLVSVYGITYDRGNNGATLTYMYVADYYTGTWLAYTPQVGINWPDGNAPQSHSFVITVPSGGCIYAYTDNGPALYMTLVQLD